MIAAPGVASPRSAWEAVKPSRWRSRSPTSVLREKSVPRHTSLLILGAGPLRPRRRPLCEGARRGSPDRGPADGVLEGQHPWPGCCSRSGIDWHLDPLGELTFTSYARDHGIDLGDLLPLRVAPLPGLRRVVPATGRTGDGQPPSLPLWKSALKRSAQAAVSERSSTTARSSPPTASFSARRLSQLCARAS